ncbi:MAG: hypothetical protein A4S09_12675 [Proteobacteria bacterium SG_bin7]|nr:MAG: hypothetical protein A4S09_12675 [Proteobacteria bacterium SG_bin7]
MSLLRNIRIIDLSRVLAGPYCTQVLGDLGAKVMKIEHPELGDETRHWGPPFFNGESCYFLSTNRNKKITELNLKNARDRAKLISMLEKADVLVENFRVGYLEKYLLDYNSLKKKFPKLIYCSITGFGQSGPYAKKPGYDLLIQALGGIMSITGPNEKTPIKVGVAITDITTGLYAVIAILSAILERQKSKKGQHIDLALFDTQVSWLAHRAINYLATGKVEKTYGNDHPTIVPYGVFQAKDKPFAIAVGNDEQFRKFCGALGVDWSADKRFKTNPARVKNRAVLCKKISFLLKKKPRNFWLKRLDGSDVPCAPINNFADLARDPQQKFKGLFMKMSDGKIPCLKSPMSFSRTPIKKYKIK